MSDVADLTLKVLERIHAEMATMNAKLDTTNAKLEELRAEVQFKLDTTNTKLEELRAEAQLQAERTERGNRDVGDFMRQIARDQAKHEAWHTNHVNQLERDVDDLKERVSKLEERGESP